MVDDGAKPNAVTDLHAAEHDANNRSDELEKAARRRRLLKGWWRPIVFLAIALLATWSGLHYKSLSETAKDFPSNFARSQIIHVSVSNPNISIHLRINIIWYPGQTFPHEYLDLIDTSSTLHGAVSITSNVQQLNVVNSAPDKSVIPIQELHQARGDGLRVGEYVLENGFKVINGTLYMEPPAVQFPQIDYLPAYAPSPIYSSYITEYVSTGNFLANGQIDMVTPPGTLEEGAYNWRAGTDDTPFTPGIIATSLEAASSQSDNAFISGIIFGIAGAAVIAVLQELPDEIPFRIKRKRKPNPLDTVRNHNQWLTS